MIKLLHRLTMEEDVMAKKNTAEIGFERQIWDAACVLRGNMDASEYKNVVLGLIFLKYISDRFDEKYHLPATVQKPVNFISHICSQATDRAIGTFAFLFVLKSASYLLVEIEKIQQEECEREKDSKL